jgi:peptidoglycan/LPS O-acetylase OafA/YrhL
MKLRLDIQGLRSLAVIAVLIFHINSKYLAGGFLGVDIFFVISGFLMTNILVNDYYKNNKINLIKFYFSRLKRIVPALFVALFITLLLSLLIFSKEDIQKTSNNIYTSFLFISNIFFSNQTFNYWDKQIYTSPFLHTWSLSVEWQYYLIYPLILMIVINVFKKFNVINKIIILNIFMFIISFLLAKYYININADKKAFYLLYSRAFELSLGALTALFLLKKPKFNLSNFYQNMISILAFILLIISLFFDGKKIGFPVFGSLIPIFSTSILIYLLSNPNLFLYKFLKNNILVYIGNLSYSLYLYHFIIYIFIKYISDCYLLQNNLSIVAEIIIFILSFLFAHISYIFIEKPLKKLPIKFVVSFILFISFLSSLIIFINHYYSTNDNKTNDNNIMMEKVYLDSPQAKSPNIEYTKCKNATATTQTINHKCYNIKDDKNYDVLLIGNSQVGHYSYIIGDYIKKHNLSVKIFGRNSCEVFTETIAEKQLKRVFPPNQAPDCKILYSEIMKEIKNSKIKYLFIAGSFGISNPKNEDDFLKRYHHKFKQVLILGLIPTDSSSYKYFPIKDKYIAKFFIKSNDFKTTKLQEEYNYYDLFQKKYNNVMLFDPTPYLESAKVGDQYLYIDGGHLNLNGALHVAPFFQKQNPLKLSN